MYSVCYRYAMTTVTTIRMTQQTRQDIDDYAGEHGITMAAAINVLLRKGLQAERFAAVRGRSMTTSTVRLCPTCTHTDRTPDCECSEPGCPCDGTI